MTFQSIFKYMKSNNPLKRITRTKGFFIICVLSSAIMISGCAGVILVAAGAGAFSYVKGNVIKTYEAEYYQAVSASDGVLEELKIPVRNKTSDALKTVIDAQRADGTSLVIQIKRYEHKLTRISVRTGVVGLTDREASEQIHFYIDRRLKSQVAVYDSTKTNSPQDMTYNSTPRNDEHGERPLASGMSTSQKKPSSEEPARESTPQIGKVNNSPAPVSESEAQLSDDYSSFHQKRHYIYYSADEQGIPVEANAIITRVTEHMLENSTSRIRIRGYTDSSGDPEYNVMISQNRVNAIKSHLISKGIEAERISALGVGPRNFIASNKTAKLRALNRRVELELY